MTSRKSSASSRPARTVESARSQNITVSWRRGLRAREVVRGRRGNGNGLGRPDQALSVLVAGEPPEGELLPRRVQECLVALEDLRERSIGHTALALEKRDEGRERRVRSRPGVRVRSSDRARGRGGGLR